MFDSIILLRFHKTKVGKEDFYGAKKKTIKIWDIDFDNIVISKLTETKNNSKYLIEYLDEAMVLIIPKMCVSVKSFKDKNNKMKFLRIDDDKLLEKYKTIWTKIEDLKNTELNALPIYDNRYMKN